MPARIAVDEVRRVVRTPGVSRERGMRAERIAAGARVAEENGCGARGNTAVAKSATG
jgi:hypothetical protein